MLEVKLPLRLIKNRPKRSKTEGMRFAPDSVCEFRNTARKFFNIKYNLPAEDKRGIQMELNNPPQSCQDDVVCCK